MTGGYPARRLTAKRKFLASGDKTSQLLGDKFERIGFSARLHASLISAGGIPGPAARESALRNGGIMPKCTTETTVSCSIMEPRARP